MLTSTSSSEHESIGEMTASWVPSVVTVASGILAAPSTLAEQLAITAP
jgi:hypothetical protein